MKKLSFLSLIFLLIFVACRKDDDALVVTVDEDDPKVLVRNTLRGQVLSETGEPVTDALVTVLTESTRTDKNGRFKFTRIDVEKDGGLVKVEKPGFFEGVKFVNFTADGSSFSRLTVMKKETPQSFDSRQPATIRLNGGATVKFEPNSIVTSSGQVFNGQVEIAARYLDPVGENIGAIMPGDLTGTDSDGNEFALATYGMTVFELETPSGLKLDLKDGTTAEIEMPIPPELKDGATDDMPLWFFDQDEEQWLLSGNCKKSSSGNSYICKVPSTGIWNCDKPLEAICLTGQVFNADSTFASFVRVEIQDLTDNFIYWGWTDSLGTFCGSVPRAAPLRLTIKDHCDNVLYTEDIGPFADDFELDPIFLDDIVNEYLINIVGGMSHCMTNDIPVGHIGVRIPGRLAVFPLTSGGLNSPLGLKCTDFPEMEITGYSLSQDMSTTPIIHTDSSDVNLGSDFRTCQDFTDFFNLNVDTLNFITAPTQYYFRTNVTTNWLVLEGVTPYGEMSIELRDYTGLGVYDVNAFFKTTNLLSDPFYPNLDSASPDISVEITEDNGDFITGTITGTAKDLVNEEYPISGDFVIRRAP